MTGAPRTAAAMLAAIVGLLKDDAGAWRDDVNGADFIQEVSAIIDAPTAAPAAIPKLFTLENEIDQYADYYAYVNYKSAGSAVRVQLTHDRADDTFCVSVHQESSWGEFEPVIDKTITAAEAAVLLAVEDTRPPAAPTDDAVPCPGCGALQDCTPDCLHTRCQRCGCALWSDTCDHCRREDAAAPVPHWWIVTLRVSGDDEDSLYVVQAATDAEAIDIARERITEDHSAEPPIEPLELFVNHVCDCGTVEPIHVRTAP